jgi:hypothetical protein
LTKDSDLKNFVAFDVGSRLGNIEQQFSQLKSALSESASDRTALEDTISILKNRGKDWSQIT